MYLSFGTSFSVLASSFCGDFIKRLLSDYSISYFLFFYIKHLYSNIKVTVARHHACTKNNLVESMNTNTLK